MSRTAAQRKTDHEESTPSAFRPFLSLVPPAMAPAITNSFADLHQKTIEDLGEEIGNHALTVGEVIAWYNMKLPFLLYDSFLRTAFAPFLAVMNQFELQKGSDSEH